MYEDLEHSSWQSSGRAHDCLDHLASMCVVLSPLGIC